ncbi:MAG: agmatine deiminase family protein [Hahellaceae bacterium]|nr:agmatine deiminase family protein [Hahellaceae bacterium]
MTTSSSFRMPAEWAKHTRCWMAWPCDEDQWDNGIDKARAAFARVAQAIATFEPVTIVCRPGHEATVKEYLQGQVEILAVDLDDSWMRDMGPTFVLDASGNKAGVNWVFNGWGKYAHDNDTQVATNILASIGVPRIDSALVNEGGGIHVDGEGTILLTETVQLNANRNPQWSKQDVEQELQHQLGVSKCIWLPQGVVDDDTDGHIDELACFVAPGKVLALITRDETDANYAILAENLRILRQSRDAKGRLLEVVTVEQPKATYNGGVRLSTSYINFYIANGGVVMPGYGDSKADAEAKRIISECFPARQVIQVDCRDIVVGGGNIHCITQQEPAPL